MIPVQLGQQAQQGQPEQLALFPALQDRLDPRVRLGQLALLVLTAQSLVLLDQLVLRGILAQLVQLEPLEPLVLLDLREQCLTYL